MFVIFRPANLKKKKIKIKKLLINAFQSQLIFISACFHLHFVFIGFHSSPLTNICISVLSTRGLSFQKIDSVNIAGILVVYKTWKRKPPLRNLWAPSRLSINIWKSVLPRRGLGFQWKTDSLKIGYFCGQSEVLSYVVCE